MSIGPIVGITGKLKTLLSRIPTDNTTKMARLDDTISSRASSTEVAKATDWPPALATKLDTNADSPVSDVQTVVDANATAIANISPIVKVHRDVFTWSGTGTSKTDTISPALSSMDKASLHFTYRYNDSTVTTATLLAETKIAGRITSTSEITFYREASSSVGPATIYWEVIEYK